MQCIINIPVENIKHAGIRYFRATQSWVTLNTASEVATEIAGLDTDGPTKMQGWTLQ